jgi:tetratricopeptide (TPR) repeat protein
VLRYEVLGQPTEALGELAALPERWPEADVLTTAAGYRIGKLLDRGRTEQAVTELRSYEQRHGPAGADLLELAVRGLREAFRVLPAAQAEAKVSLVRAYLDWAQRLYADRSERPIGQRYEITQLLAGARLWSGYLGRSRGRPDEAQAYFRSALELFQECRKHNRRRRAGSDPAVLLGAARAQAALGHHQAARDAYAKLLGLVDRQGDPPLFWRAELEYCTCLLEAFRSQRETLSAVAVRIRQLRRLDERMGGWKEAFDRLASDVEAARQSLARGDRR